jgi:hypothetical protein
MAREDRAPKVSPANRSNRERLSPYHPCADSQNTGSAQGTIRKICPLDSVIVFYVAGLTSVCDYVQNSGAYCTLSFPGSQCLQNKQIGEARRRIMQ